MAESEALFPGYEDVRLMRRGPITSSYRAVQVSIRRAVVIKALNQSVLPTSPFAQALEREAQVLARLHHPSFQQVHDFVRTEQRMWLVLENVEGWTLGEVLSRLVTLPQDVASAVTIQLALALDHLHERDIVLADLTPEHVMLTPSGEVRIVGFAMASLPGFAELPELLEGEQGVALPFYRSPEHVLGERLSPISDIYSAGVILYEMLSGRRPFQAPEARTVSQMIRNDAPPTLQELGVAVPSGLDRIARRAMEKLPADRFSSAREFAVALRENLPSSASHQRLTREALLSSGFLDGTDVEPRVTIAPPPPRRSWLKETLGVYVACFAAILIGGGALQIFLRKPAAVAAAAQRLELAPETPAFLRVVAFPWAHVVVDGQRVDTTPFARAIPLTPGTHYVQLEHPEAPSVKRTLQLSAGENVLLDITMDVPPAPAPPPVQKPPTETEAPTP